MKTAQLSVVLFGVLCLTSTWPSTDARKRDVIKGVYHCFVQNDYCCSFLFQNMFLYFRLKPVKNPKENINQAYLQGCLRSVCPSVCMCVHQINEGSDFI